MGSGSERGVLVWILNFGLRFFGVAGNLPNNETTYDSAILEITGPERLISPSDASRPGHFSGRAWKKPGAEKLRSSPARPDQSPTGPARA